MRLKGWRACVCGCGSTKRLHGHHVIYQQELRAVVRTEQKASGAAGPTDIVREMALIRDPRNLVPVGYKCHGNHHNGSKRYRLEMLPDSVFEFAAEVLGAGRAYEYLRRRYAGSDARLDALIEVEAA